jgi:hypothetical protein
MCKSSHIAGAIGQGVADVWSAEAVPCSSIAELEVLVRSSCLPNTSVLGVCFAVLLLDLCCPFWDLRIRKSCVLLLPRLEIEPRFARFRSITMEEHWILDTNEYEAVSSDEVISHVLKVVQSQCQVSSM